MRICGLYKVRGTVVRLLSIRGKMAVVYIQSGIGGKLIVPLDEVK